MRKQKGLIMGVIMFAIVLMAIGYAAIESTGLTITGSAKASASQDNFKVYFTGDYTPSSEVQDAIAVGVQAQATTATVNFNEALGLTTIGDSAHVILKIHNGSAGVDADSVTVTTDATDTDIFDFAAVMCDSTGKAISDYSVASNADTFVKISVVLKASPTEATSANLSVALTAVPAEAK